MIPRPDFDDSALARALRSLPRLQAPVELEARVQDSIEQASLDGSPLAEALGSMSRVEAPAELDQRVALALEAAAAAQAPEEPSEGWEDGIGTLPRLSAPSVLDRLVAEEIANPAATAERFIGDLPRPSGQPAVLAFESEASSRTLGEAATSSTWLRRPALRAGLALAAAAGILVWLAPAGLFGTDSSGKKRPEREFSTPFLWADQVSDLEPAAQLLAEGLSGGRLSSALR